MDVSGNRAERLYPRERFGMRGKLNFDQRKFIAHVLAIEGNIIYDEQTKAIDKYGLNRSGIMRKQRGYRIRGTASFTNPHLEVYFVKYLRFHDMRRDNMRGGYHTIFGEEATKKRRRQYHLYNRIVFGRMNAIANRLMYGFTEEVKRELAAEYNIPIDG